MYAGYPAHCINEIEYANTGIAHFHISSHTQSAFPGLVSPSPLFLRGMPVVAFLLPTFWGQALSIGICFGIAGYNCILVG